MAEVPRSGRLATLRQLLAEGRYASQAELSEALAGHGISVSQSTLSKDLVTLAAIRQRTADGSLVYALSPEEHEDAVVQRLAQLCSELLQSVRHAGNQIVVRVPPGAAQYFASYLDRAELTGVMGTIAGDDTVLVIVTDEETASAVVECLTEMTRSGTLRDGR